MRGVAARVRSTIINTSMALSIPFSVAIMSTTMPSSESSKLINSGRSSMESLSQITDFIQGIRNSLLASAILNIIAAVISYLREEKRQPPFTRIVYSIE
jgi:hypothetical protein